MNATAWQDMRRIWLVTTLHRGEKTMLLLGWLALAFGSIAGMGALLAILAHKKEPLFLLQMLSGFAAVWLGLVWMALFVPASILLNSPANARLVPRQRRRLMQMAAGSWFLVCAGMAFASREWIMFPAVGLTLIGFALMRAGRGAAGLLFVVGLNWDSLSRHVLPPAVVEAVGSDAGLWIMTALLAPAGAWTLRTMYPAAGDTHIAKRGEQVQTAAWWQRLDVLRPGEITGLSPWATAYVYGAALRRMLRRPRPGTMLMQALGPNAHWSAWLAGIATVAVIGGAGYLLLAWQGGRALQRFTNGPMAAALAALVIGIAFSTAVFSQQLRKTTGEQALLRLTPLAGNAALLNRRLAVGLLGSALCNWAMLTAMVLLATALVGAGPAALLRQAALSVLAGQVAAMGLLDDFTGEGGWSVSLALQAGLLAAAELLVALGLDKLSGVSLWIWVAVIAAAMAAWQLRRSWRRMLAAAPAFPAGRMA